MELGNTIEKCEMNFQGQNVDSIFWEFNNNVMSLVYPWEKTDCKRKMQPVVYFQCS